MNPWIPTYAFLAAVMNDIIGYDPSSGMAGVLRAPYIGLGIAPTPPPSATLLMGGITEATYTGYARQALTWFPTFLDVLGPQTVQSANVQFRASDGVTPNSITTIFIASALTAGTLLLTAAVNPNVPLVDALHALQASVLFQLPFTGIYGRCLINS
jgi:hypothetical protein